MKNLRIAGISQVSDVHRAVCTTSPRCLNTSCKAESASGPGEHRVHPVGVVKVVARVCDVRTDERDVAGLDSGDACLWDAPMSEKT